ncbi:MAG: endonuclease III [Ruminococcaceae bacterium]|nr:endonuclease III [Oscillospiraceae bacterium]
MIRSKKEKRDRLKRIIERLKEIYPEAVCALEYEGDAWKLLVMGRLSAQCTDARVNVVCKELFAKYPNSKAMAEGKIEEIEKIVRPCGLFRTKASNIKDASKIIEERYGGCVPDEMDGLLELPGVGRKIANLILGDAFGKEAIVCDTHCIRICARLGMYPESLKDAVKVEYILRDLMDVSEGSDFCHRIVTFGREVCTARSPACEACPLSDLCEKRIRESVGRSRK